MATPLTWLGHSAFRLDTPEGKRVYIDPWLDNPKCPPGETQPGRIDVIVLTHGHPDHSSGVAELAQRFATAVVAPDEVTDWLVSQGAPQERAYDLNRGGSAEIDGVRFTLTTANHSSSGPSNEYLGEPCGVVLELEDGLTLYFAGDTNVFGDMSLIARIYRPDVAILPIGDHYTMGPREAAVAVELLGVKRVVPCHYGTFPVLVGTPGRLRELVPTGVEVLAPEPGDTIEL
jgi:L-ascorbate metabolism protein UlaG (beta-lactamase superfamily)